MATTPNPLTTEWIPLWNLNTSSSATAAPHHTTHEIGGTDVIQNVAWLNQANIFTANQRIIITRPYLEWQNTGDTSFGRIGKNATTARLDVSANLKFDGTNLNSDDTTRASTQYSQYDGYHSFFTLPAGANPRSPAIVNVFTLAPDSLATFTGNLLISKIGPDIQLLNTVGTAKIHLLNPGGTGGSQTILSYNLFFNGTNWVRDDVSNAGGLLAINNAGAFGYYRVVAAANPASLIATLTIDAAGAVSIPGTLTVTGTTRASTFISTSTSNNLLDLTCGPTNFTNGLNGTGNIIFTGYLQMGNVIWPGYIDAPTGSQGSFYLSAHHTWGLYSNTSILFEGGIYTNATLNCKGVIYPGRVDIGGGALQTNWYLGSHGSYGLYCNTGFYCAAIYSGPVTCTTFNNQNAWMTCGPATFGTAQLAAAFVSIAANASANQCLMMRNTANGTNMLFVGFQDYLGTSVGSISQSGNTVNYLGGSDARLKIDLGRATDVTSLRQVVIHDFNWKSDGIRDCGLFAQEAHHLFPNAVFPGTDELNSEGTLLNPWMTDYSKLVPYLIVGWQQHDEEIVSLRAELAALKQRMN